jgi:hypothetical protein
MKAAGLLLSALLLLGQSPPPETLSETQIRDLIRKSADNDVENTKRQRDYTYVQRNEQRKVDRKGNVTLESKTFEVLVLSGEPTQKLIAKDDKPLSEKEARSEEEKIQKLVAKYQKEDEGQRRKRLAKGEKDAEDERRFVREIADAFHFRQTATEMIDGRPNYVIEGDPLPGYKPKVKDADVLPKVKFRAWIDKADAQWTKLDVESLDTISWGLLIARIQKGSTMHFEQVRINDEVWLPKRFSLKANARVMLLKSLNLDWDVTFRDYKKFSAAATIKPLGEVEEK